MSYPSLSSFLTSGVTTVPSGPVAVLFVEDDAVVRQTLEHHAKQGFPAHLVIGDVLGLADLVAPMGERFIHIEAAIRTRDDAVEHLNTLMDVLSGRWVFWGFNAEFLFYPYCESRTITDLTSFIQEERRDHAFTYTIDLYAQDLYRHPNAVTLDTAYFDGSGYYGFQRYEDGEALERQVNVFGGLGWRFEEFVPWERRRIDRVSLFRAKAGLRVGLDLRLSEPEMNTVACPWHHNVTIAMASFRVAKSLKRNPGSTFEVDSMMWRRSMRFDWSSQQLMEEGLIEPGQWF